MDQEKLTRLAKEYVSLEQDGRFAEEVERLLHDRDYEALNDRFYTSLSFGTGGLRGVIGGGYNRMNPFMVRRATQGLANYVKKQGIEHPKAVIAHDSRRYSPVFAEEAARVLCANGITTYLFSSLRPTPELSFAVRRLGATTGIVVTASHNPPQYNGYKVYWSDGGQIIHPHDSGIISEVGAVTTEIHSLEAEEARSRGLLITVDKVIDDAFIAMVKSYSLRPELLRKRGREVKVVYTPLHGAGRMPVERTMHELGVEVVTVPEQREPDGNFPTVEYPNPEEASAMKLALALGEREHADLVLGTDPDSDRLGIAVPGEKGFVLITGNQLGALLTDYIFAARKELRKLPRKPAFVNTIVTTDLQRRIAKSYGAAVYEVLTGFKYIADMMRRFEKSGEGFIFGAEESYGFLVETEVRDKDAVSAAMMAVEMTLYHRSRGKSVLDALEELYLRFGYYRELLLSRGFAGESGIRKMSALMDSMRSKPPASFGGSAVVAVKDYEKGTTTPMEGGVPGRPEKDIDLPTSNVLQFYLADGGIVTARPSGTEPKIKFYASCCSKPGVPLSEAERVVDAEIARIEQEIDRIMASVA